MDHNKLHNYIKFFLKGKLSQQNEKKLLLWIKQSDDNRKLFIQEQRRLSKEIVSDSDKTINMRWHMLKKKIEHQEGTKKQLFFHIASVAAAFIVGIILSILYLGLNQSGTNQSAQIQTITVPFGARTSTTLPDGSKVWLNAG